MFDQVLRPLNSKRKMKYSVMDIETTKWTKVRLVGFYDGQEYVDFRSVEDFLHHFLRRKYEFWKCFAHFGSGFDFNFILEAMENDPELNKFRMKILSNNGVSMIRIYDHYKSDRTWTFLDSHRLLPKAQADLTKSFNVEHKKLDVNRSNLDSLNYEELRHYNEFDCKGLYEVLKSYESWFDDYGIALKATTASQAMSLFRSTLKYPIPVLKPKVEQFIRKSYYGGRVEVFKMKCNEKFYYYDVRSLYPSVMKKFPMPVGTPHRTNVFHDDKIGFYKCSVKIPDMYLPPLPTVQNHKLLFPIGKFEGIYSSAELKLAADMGCQFDVDYGYYFQEDYIFNEYIDKMYPLKENGDSATRDIAKLMLNSLYGKFGQNRKKLILMKYIGADLKGKIPYDQEHALYQEETNSRATFIIPSIASWITSCARTELMKWLLKSGEQNIYYCDTDSVVSTKPLPIGKGIGELKLEYEGNRAIFLLPKMYVLDVDGKMIVRGKGFERDFTGKLSYQDFENALSGDKSAFKQDTMRFGKFKEVLRRENHFVGMLQKKKSIKSEYSKRLMIDNYDTRPVTISHT